MFISTAHAQAAAAAPEPNGLLTLAPLVLVFIAFYFLMIRPQQRRVKALAATIDAVRKGDSVVTSGGILGRVTKVEDTVVEVEIAPTVRIRVVKATLTEVTPLSKPAND